MIACILHPLNLVFGYPNSFGGNGMLSSLPNTIFFNLETDGDEI